MDPGTIAQWAAPFVAFALTFLRKPAAERQQTDVNDTVAAIVSQLGEKRMYLLKCVELRNRPCYPEKYASLLAAFDNSPSEDSGWPDAAKYACAFLSALGLVGYYGTEVAITDFGRAVLASPIVRATYSDALSKAADISARHS